MRPAFPILGAALIALATGSASAETVSVAIGGRQQMTYLPFTIANQLGYFKDAGVTLAINDFPGGSKSIEALVGDSVDVSISAYEHTIYLQPKGQRIEAIALFTKSYGAVLGLTPKLAAAYHGPKDLKGLKIGVTAPGSSSALVLTILMAKAGLTNDDLSIIGVGGGATAVSAIKSGRFDGLSHFDPMISELVHDGDIVPVVDTRTEAGMKEVYGGYIAASSAEVRPEWAKAHPQAAQAFVTAIVRALKWIATASPQTVADTVPPDYYGKDKKLYEDSFKAARPAFSSDGVVEQAAAQNTYTVLLKYGGLKSTDVDLAKTYDNHFAAAASEPNR